MLGELLSATPRLKYLHFEHEFVFSAATPTGPSLSSYLGLDELNTALFPVRDTLEECHFILRLGPGSISTTGYPLASVRFPAVQGTLTMLKFMPRLVKVEVSMTMLLGWHPRFAAKLEEVLPHGLVDLTLRDDQVRYCPWVAPCNAEKKVIRIAEYMHGRSLHATHLQSLKVRLTSAKRSLMHSVATLNISTTSSGSKTSLTHGKKSETYGWAFEKAQPVVPSPTTSCHTSRKDSVFRPKSSTPHNPNPQVRHPRVRARLRNTYPDATPLTSKPILYSDARPGFKTCIPVDANSARRPSASDAKPTST